MKIALVYSDDFSLWVFRRGLISRLIEADYEVYFLCTGGKYVHKLEELGAIHVPIEVDRFINLAKDLKLLLRLYILFKRYKFDIVHTFTIKPNLYGAMAARAARIENIITSVTGLGILEPEIKVKSLRNYFMQYISRKLYNISCRCSNRVWFQNDDDRSFFKKAGIISGEKQILIRSSGVNLSQFSPESADNMLVAKLKNEIGIKTRSKCVVMVSRAIANKGVYEFISASEMIGKKHPNVIFVLVGDNDPGHPLSVPVEFLQSKQSRNFRWLGFRDCITELQYIADVSVLPSYYPEGVPRNLLEAMAMGNPIVTTNNVGCREVVFENINGHIVPIKNAELLAKAIEDILLDEEKRKSYGRHSRTIACELFSEKTVVDRIISELYQL